MKTRHRLAALLLPMLWLGGCSVLPPQQPPARVHDFGPPPGNASPSATRVQPTVNASAPDWLDSDAILYRFLFHDPTQLRRYSRNRWAAPPAQLVAQRVRLDLEKTSGAAAGGALTLQLQRFEQVFTQAHQAHAVVRVLATLHDADGRPRASRVFRVTRPCATADVDGGVRALSAAAGAAASEIASWAASSPAH